jgi:hypothetical protein
MHFYEKCIKLLLNLLHAPTFTQLTTLLLNRLVVNRQRIKLIKRFQFSPFISYKITMFKKNTQKSIHIKFRLKN